MATDKSYQKTLEVPAGVTGDFTATIYDEDGSILPGSSIDEVTLKLTTGDGTVINSRTGSGSAANVTVSEAGVLLWEMQEEDTDIQAATVQLNQKEIHDALFEWTYATTTKRGRFRLLLECVKIAR